MGFVPVTPKASTRRCSSVKTVHLEGAGAPRSRENSRGDSDPLGSVRTQVTPSQPHHLHTTPRENRRDQIPEKITRTVHAVDAYGSQLRQRTRSPILNKNTDKHIIAFDGLKPGEDISTLKRALHRQGVNVAAARAEVHPLLHTNTGKGVLVVDSADQSQHARAREKLQGLGLKTADVETMNGKIH